MTVLKGYLTILTNVRRYQTHHRWLFSFRKTAQRIGALCIVHATQSNCCGSLDFLSLKPCPPAAPSWTHWPQDLRSHTAAWVWVMSQKRLKKSSSNWLNSGNALIQRVKNAIFVLPVLPGSAEAQVIWGDIVKCLLAAYFIGNISAKNIKIRQHVSTL